MSDLTAQLIAEITALKARVASLEAKELPLAIDTDTYNDSVAKILGTDADGGLRLDHLDVGSATGAVEGEARLSSKISLGNCPLGFQSTYYVATVVPDAAANVVAMTTNAMMMFLVVSYTLGGNLRGSIFLVLGGSTYEVYHIANVMSATVDTATHVNLYLTGGVLTIQNKQATNVTEIYVQVIGQNN